MSDKKFDLNKFLQQPKLFTPIDYSGVVVPDLSGVQQTVDNLDEWRKSQGYRTNEEKLKEAQEKASAAIAELGNSEDVYDWYNAFQDNPRKQAEFRQQGAQVAGLLMTVPLTIASAGTMGWVPALTSTATGFAGAYGGQKLGEVIDTKYGTNTTPWLALAGGFAGGIGGYKGLVKAGSAGLLKGSGQMYGKQFIGDVASDFMNKKLSNPDLYKNILSQNLHNSHTNLTDNWSNLPPIKVSADDITDWNKLGVGENAEYLNQHLPLSPASELRSIHPSLTVDPLVPDAIAENTGKLARFGSDKGKPIYKHYFPDGHGNVEIDGKLYHVGKSNRPKTNTLVHQNGSNNPIVYGKLQPILSKHPEEPTAIWWEQNTPYYGKQSTLPTFVIDDVVPSASARNVTRFGNSTSRLTDAVDLTDPKTNFKFFTYDPISGEMVQSPFVFPKQQSTKGSYAFYERPSKLTEAERLGIPKGERKSPLKSRTPSQEFSNDYISAKMILRKPTYEYEDLVENYLRDDSAGEFNKMLKEYVSYARSKGSPVLTSEISEPIVKGYRNYLHHLDFDAADLSDEELRIILSKHFNDLSNSASGKMKNQLVWHSSPTWFDEFDYRYTGTNMENSGAMGPGNYFSKEATMYGRGKKGEYSGKYSMGNTQPYVITKVSSTPSGKDMQDKGLLPRIIQKYRGRDHFGQKWDPDPEFDIKLKEQIDQVPINDDKMYVLKGTDSGFDKLYSTPFNVPGGELMIRRNTGIKSLYPHPSRFVRDEDGFVHLLPANWNDPRVNFKEGGKINLQQ